MVMHARKVPRLNDGYHDRHDYHEGKNDCFQERNSNGDRKPINDRRNRDEHDLINDRQNSPRYNHKTAYAARRRPEKERYDKYNREHERYNREEFRFGDKHENDLCLSNSSRTHVSDDCKSIVMDKHTSADTSVDTSRSNDRGCRHTSEERKSIPTSGNPEKSSKDPRTEARKTALRVWGDWSEHASSSGKKYFYNCKTEVSQWVKPDEWKTEEQTNPENIKSISSFTVNTKGEETRRNGAVTSHSVASDSLTIHRRDKVGKNSRITINNHGSESTKCIPLGSQRSTGSNPENNEQSKHSRVSNQHHLHKPEHLSSVGTTPSSSILDTGSPTIPRCKENCKVAADHQVTNGINDGSSDDMDISPDNSPRQSAEDHHSALSGGQHAISMTTSLQENECHTQTLGQLRANSADQSVWGKALETLQTLQEVLKTRGVTNQTGISSLTNGSPASTTSHSPKTIPLSAQTGQVSDVGADRIHSVSELRVGSPAVSETCVGQHSVLSAAAESLASGSLMLPQSLTNYYDPSLIGHMLGWPAEQVELRAHMAYKDAMVICAHHCGQVSTELKRDRSHVRIAEVQSTLIEHRIMFLKQQISELETQDRNFSSGQT